MRGGKPPKIPTHKNISSFNLMLMHIILVYDISGNKSVKMLKLCSRYLNWVQNSVFEGEITEAKLNQLIAQIHRIINKELDCVIIYSSRHSSWAERKVLGIEQNPIKNIL